MSNFEFKSKSYEEICVEWQMAKAQTVDGVHNVLLDKKYVSLDDVEQVMAEWESVCDEFKSKILAFEKWLALGTPFESAKFDHDKVLAEYRKLFNLQSNKGEKT